MNAKETMRLMMGFEAQKCLDSLETLGKLARGLDYEDAAKKTRVGTGARRGRGSGAPPSGTIFGGQR